MIERLEARITLAILLSVSLATQVALAAPVRGKLEAQSPQDYRIVAINRSAQSTVATVASDGKFSIAAGRGATLHLVGAGGKYVGPIGAVKGSKFYTALSGKKGNVGKVTFRDGFATIKYNGKSAQLFGRDKVGYDQVSGPLGAGKFGLVRNPVGNVLLNEVRTKDESDQLGEDLDRDGLPDILDIDDDGDLVLDIVDPVAHEQSDYNGEITSTLRLELVNSLNINVGAVTDSQIDELVKDNLFLLMLLQSKDSESVESVNIDCGSLSYCSSNGTATIQMDNPPIANGSLWSSYDPDSDGLPNLSVRSGQMPEINLRPHATRSQIGTGDTIFFKVATSGGVKMVPAVLPFVFVTSPALKEYASGGESATISYPVSAGGSGTSLNPFALTSQQVSFTFWKPQRSAIAGAEPPGYIDMGGLRYGVYVSRDGAGLPIACAASDYSNLSATLQPLSNANGVQVVEDIAGDLAATISNTLSFTLDLGACLTRQGVSPSGQRVMIDLTATSQSQDQTSQSFYLQLP